jgi:TetR/AcrR family transcriptional regulator of autoinduction and epiphytic fitness
MVDDVKRRYDSTRRREQASQTRRRILEVSGPLFITHGYAAASMRQVSDAAGVSLQTLYNNFDSKFGLFSALMDTVIAGDDVPIALKDRPAVRALDDIEDPAEYLDALVDVAVPILHRLSDIFPTLRAAASSDPQVAAAYRAYALDARYVPYRNAGISLKALSALAPELDARAAADVMWTILSPDTYHLLVNERNWSTTQFRNWATTTLRTTIATATH